jgi:ABC-2 type transport system ATP-binding protein
MSGAAIELVNVTRHYAGAPKPAVSGMNLRVEPGSVFGLLGPNGAGKSTTVMMLCGLMFPDEGSVRILGMDTKEDSEEIRRQVGVATQEVALMPSLTAYENLFYFGRMYGLRAADIKKSIERDLHIFGLTSKANKRVQTFSGGMKRRLNLIAALLHNPKILILDEPTTGVDVQSRNMILDFLIDLKQHGTTIIYTSHLMEEAEKICTDLAIVDEGKVVERGTPGAMFKAHPECRNLEQYFLKITGKNIRD